MTHLQEINDVYQHYLQTIQPEHSFAEVLRRAIAAYEAIVEINRKHGFWQHPNKHDHKLVFYLTQWIFQHVEHPSLKEISEYTFAMHITDYILYESPN
ncbi:MAG: hypothetical protein MUF87_22330 [Anaerolineae bacterium]|jgi:hypothetical protein|nr:hypothetical protein [Anaerolineae bacterium]